MNNTRKGRVGRRGWLGRGVDRHHSALPEVRLVHTCAFKYVSGNILCACTNAPLGLAARVEGRGYLCLSLRACTKACGGKKRRRRRKGQIGRDRAKKRGPIGMERGRERRIAFQRAVLLNEILIQPLFTE